MKKSFYLIYMIIGFGAMALILFYNFSTFTKGMTADDYSSYIRTTAIVKDLIPQKTVIGKKRRGHIPAVVTFKTVEGRSVEAGANILSLPVLGAVAKKGDSVTVFYNPKNPLNVITYADKYNIFGGYGLFIIGGFAVVISLIVAFRRISAAKM